MDNAQFTTVRINRLLAVCSKPATASRASHRVYKLAHRAALEKRIESRRLYALSDAINEHRHVILCGFVGDEAGKRNHETDRDSLLKSVTRGS
jgi:hypothetical protein